jgi:PPOX class probable F420-dependent enzyme
MTTLEDFTALAAQESGLVVISTLRADATIQASLVNAGVLPHPLTGQQVVGFVTYGPVKLANLRARPQLTVTARSGWSWIAVEGSAELIGPDDPSAGIDDERLRLLLREVFAAAGGNHDDWDEYDRVMADQHRTVVFVDPARIYSNRPTG